MSTSELKLILFRKIDSLPEEKLRKIEQFLETVQDNAPKQRKAGALKGFITYMAEDFDAPLEDLKEYMP
jgi:hypothetical protein